MRLQHQAEREAANGNLAVGGAQHLASGFSSVVTFRHIYFPKKTRGSDAVSRRAHSDAMRSIESLREPWFRDDHGPSPRAMHRSEALSAV